jgi:hypothetical protein
LYASKEGEMAEEIHRTGVRKHALDAFLEARAREGYEVETHRDTHAIIVARRSLLTRLRPRGADRYVVEVDEHGEVTMTPAEPKRS